MPEFDKPDAKTALEELAYVMDDKTYVGAVWETCRELYRALAASVAQLAERDEAVQRSANAATDMARLLAASEARVEALERALRMLEFSPDGLPDAWPSGETVDAALAAGDRAG